MGKDARKKVKKERNEVIVNDPVSRKDMIQESYDLYNNHKIDSVKNYQRFIKYCDELLSGVGLSKANSDYYYGTSNNYLEIRIQKTLDLRIFLFIINHFEGIEGKIRGNSGEIMIKLGSEEIHLVE